MVLFFVGIGLMLDYVPTKKMTSNGALSWHIYSVGRGFQAYGWPLVTDMGPWPTAGVTEIAT